MQRRRSNAPAASGAKVQRRRSDNQPLIGPPRPVADAYSRRPLPVKPNLGRISRIPPFVEMMADMVEGPLVSLPDNTTHATNVHRLRDVVDVSSNSGGHFLMICNPTPAGGTDAATIAAGVVTAYTNTVSPYHAAILASNTYYRTLGYTVSWTCTQTSTTAQGRIAMSAQVLVSPQNVGLVSVASIFDDEGVVAPESQQVHANLRPFTTPVYTSIVNSGASYCPCLVVAITGAAASAPLGQLTITRIVEAVPISSDISRGTATYSPCDVMACCIASNIQGPKATYASGEDGRAKLRAAGLSLAKAAMSALAGNNAGAIAQLGDMFGR